MFSNNTTIHQPVAARPSSAITAPDSLLAGYPHTVSPHAAPRVSPLQTLIPSHSAPEMESGSNPFATASGPQQEPIRPLYPAPDPLQQIGSHSEQLLRLPDPPAMLPPEAAPPINSVPPPSQPSQTPILNDALRYLDQVKIRFADRSDVYTHFLDIMKDYKSSAIDTPRVIERVSNLFAGYPMLIQGFSTFLPPGFLVECGGLDDPYAIRVTTPLGTMMQSVANGVVSIRERPLRMSETGITSLHGETTLDHETAETDVLEDEEIRRERAFRERLRESNGENTDEQDGGREVNTAVRMEYQRLMRVGTGAPAGTRDIETRSVNSGGRPERHPIQPSREEHLDSAELGRGLIGLNSHAMASTRPIDGRGPVEFNHAINYVNKIKNRFADEPEIYKQFLEILQTFQREPRPIPEVYAQVTELFSGATDLLHGFKKFLPDNSTQPVPRARLSDRDSEERSTFRDRDEALSARQEFLHHHHPIAQETQRRQPPMGVFNPPITGAKEGKKRNRTAGAGHTNHDKSRDEIKELETPRLMNNLTNNSNKKTKVSHARNTPIEPHVSSPSLVPTLPEPLLPTPATDIHQDELAFFDRIRKFIGNKQTFAEFLRVCNLCSQDIISIPTLIQRANDFIGGNTDLMRGLKTFMKYQGPLEVVENLPLANYKVSLSNCRGYGPSYRLLPNLERAKPCSGRDPMCKQVLNDAWASHPTWASEVEGFLPHKKNIHEELLHRIEEERHDYDHNIEINERTCQLLQPIAQRIMHMSTEEKENFVLSEGLGSSHNAIYTRAIMKVYGREHGAPIIQQLYKSPWLAIPAVLKQLRFKAQEWKAVRREWQKVWQDQTEKIFWKSLDHQGVNVKTNDKKLFTIKNLVSEIQTRHAEQVMGVVTHNIPMPHFQFTYSFADLDVVLDAVNLLTCYVGNSSASSSQDRQKLENFITTFFPLFFGFSSKLLQEPERLLEDGQLEQASTDQASGKTSLARARRTGPQHGQKNGLLRDVLDPNKHTRSNDPDDMVDTPGSESATPSSPGDDSTSVRTISRSASTSPLPTLERWTESLGSSRRIADGQPALSQRSVKRSDYNLYATPTIYGLFRLFQILYFRLLKIKSKELQVREDVNRRMRHKPANDLRLITRGQPETYFSKIGPGATFYPQMLRMIEELVVGTTDASFVEDCLREFYIEDGWRLYTIDKLLLAITRQIIAIVGPEPKEKSGELISLWRQDREKGDHTSYEAEIAYRKYAESFSGNESGQLFRITWATTRNEATIQMVKHDTPTFLQREMNTVEKWSSYMASYELYDATEDIDYDEIIKSKRFPYLKRNVGDARLTTKEYNKLVTVETTVIKIDPVTYRRAFKKGKEVMLRAAPGSAPEGVTPRSPKHSRTLVFRRRFVEKPSWMEGLTEEEIKAKLEAYRRTVEGEEKVAGADEPSGSVANGTGDVEMS